MDSQSIGSKQWAISLLQHHIDACEEALAILSKRRDMSNEERQRVRGVYLSLRHELDLDFRQLSRRQTQRVATPIESAFVQPAIKQAHALPWPPTSSDPLRAEWFDVIESAEAMLKQHLGQIQSYP